MAILEFLTQPTSRKYLLCALFVFGLIGVFGVAKPDHRAVANNHTYVTVHYDGTEQTVATDAKTVGELIDRVQIPIGERDLIEPSRETALISNDYNVNIYRARPVTVVDAGNRYPIVTAAQSPRQIAEAAGLTVYPEDTYDTDRVDDFVSEGVGLKVTIDRSVPVVLSLYGTATPVRTQAATVADLLKEKNITLQEGDTLLPPPNAPITPNLTVSVIRNGTQMITVEEDVAFPTETIRDNDRPLGYRVVQQEGKKGRRTATYEIKLENNVEVARKELNSIVTAPPEKQVEVVGTKSNGNGLSKSKGVNLYVDSKGVAHRETYYDLPMGTVIRTCGGSYSVRPDGAKVDQEGYILVAANLKRYPRCSIVETSLGPGKVYDTGGFASVHPDGFDLATDWSNGDGR